MKRKFLLMNYHLFLAAVFLWVPPLWAKSLEQAVKDLEQKGSSLANNLAPFGIILAAVYLIFGKEEGKYKMSLAIMGTICIVGAKPIIKWLTSIF